MGDVGGARVPQNVTRIVPPWHDEMRIRTERPPDVVIPIQQRAPRDYRQGYGIEDFAAPRIGEAVALAASQGQRLVRCRLVEVEGSTEGGTKDPYIDRVELWFDATGA